ncbi:MAG: hypothetical protein DRI57_27935 [Deltaproteobacteria bacterium]|nr:MAG: hypothetical protein DRI57_27935 [Deltaproteobacteria bacterium]
MFVRLPFDKLRDPAEGCGSCRRVRFLSLPKGLFKNHPFFAQKSSFGRFTKEKMSYRRYA